MQRQKTLVLVIALVLFSLIASSAQATEFAIRPYSANEFQQFIDVFSEMRGPLRVQILKDRKNDFENADPLAYVQKVKDERDVKKMLEKHGLTWNTFQSLMGNVVLAYFSIQPDRTKASLIKQLASYGLLMQMDQIPPEYRASVTEVLKTDAGSSLAAMALEMVVQIPPQNVNIVKENERTLNGMFYTKYWREALEKGVP